MRRAIFLSILFTFLSLPSFGLAGITYPYIIDEKPQVLFGDSAVISTSTLTYYGMENYAQDYVNGYAHFTFTYTHDVCCYAGYPPLVYVTNIDPRSTNGLLEKSSLSAYFLQSGYSSNDTPTGLYLYDIQFDSTGYTVIVKQLETSRIVNVHTDVPGFTVNDWVSIVNRYPYGPDFPDMMLFSMAFTPVPVTNGPLLETINPVIIIPGIMGSTYKNGKLVIDPILHTYDDLIDTLAANGYEKGKTLFTFPYEWRDSNILSANLLKDKINQVKQICLASNLSDINCSKVDLVAHSMGGLVAREYIQSGQYQNDVDQIIFLGTPHKGSTKAYLQWEGGEFSKGIREFLAQQFFTSEARRNGYVDIFDYIHNRPILSVQQLLPTFSYIKDNGILREYPNNYPRNLFLENLNANVLSLLNSGVKITNIIGNTGTNTIQNISVIPSSSLIKWTNGQADSFELGIGDDTVTANGSILEASISNEEWNRTSHSDLPRETSARIFNLLTSKIANKIIYLSPIEKIFSIHLQSPVDMIVTAPNGKRIGKNFETGEEYNEIPNAFYSGYQTEDEYITIPNPLDGEYKIELQGTGNGGEYGVLTSYISEGISTTTEYLAVTGGGQISNLIAIINNDNPENISIKSTDQITTSVLINHITLAYQFNWISDIKTKDKLLKWAQSIVRFEEKENIKITDKKLAKMLYDELPKLLEKNDINISAYNLLKKDLEYLINN